LLSPAKIRAGGSELARTWLTNWIEQVQAALRARADQIATRGVSRFDQSGRRSLGQRWEYADADRFVKGVTANATQPKSRRSPTCARRWRSRTARGSCSRRSEETAAR
jgi:hypothetical protein